MDKPSLVPPLVRNIDANHYFENFFIFSLLSIVAIRIFLALMHYPKLGGGELHIAHMLWGGFFMVVALFLFFTFLNKSIHELASVLAGIGFGAFIDEIGKFITTDNNYFYKPTFAILYVIFVALYLLTSWVRKQSIFTREEYLANALEATKEAVIHDFDVEEKKQALSWIAKADPTKSITVTLTTLINQEQPIAVTYSWWFRLRATLLMIYRIVVSKQWVLIAAQLFIVIQLVGYVILGLGAFAYRQPVRGYLTALDIGFYEIGLIISTLAAGLLLFAGLFILVRFSRRRGFRLFRYSLRINILLVTFFIFYFNQLLALAYLVINLTFLKTFEYANVQERKLKKSSVPVQ